MRVTREQAAKNKEEILQAAKRLCRQRGFDDTGVAEVMAAAGLTHGGFYGHFKSKEDLLAQACEGIFRELISMWRHVLDPATVVPQLARQYLTMEHCRDSGTACPMATLAADAARAEGPVREAYTEGVRGFMATLTEKLGGDRPQALRLWSTLTGAVSIARSVDDPALAQEILDACLAELT